MAPVGPPVDHGDVRAPTVVTVVAAGCAAVLLGGLAVVAATQVPDTPAPAYIPHYVDELRNSPPPATSASILARVVDGDDEGPDEGPDDEPTATTTPTTPATADDHGGDRGGDDGDGSGNSGPGSGGSSGSGGSGSSGSGHGGEADDDD